MGFRKAKALSPFQKECLAVVNTIIEWKTAAEATVVSILYKKPDLLRQTRLMEEEFDQNEWRVYFVILKDIILKEKKNVIDDIIIGIYLEKHPKLRERYEEFGGYETIENAGEYVKEESFEGSLIELRKWGAILKLAKKGWVSQKKLKEYADSSVNEIYNEFQVYINDVFANIDYGIKTYDISDGLRELIDELDQGMEIGLEYANMPLLSHETGGQRLGTITLVGGISNSGKSSLIRNCALTSIIKNDEKIVVILNEEDDKKWKREFLVTVANNILNEDLQKHIVRNGNYTQHNREILERAAEWIEEHVKKHMITIIPLQFYTTATAIKLINKYSAMGVNYFIIDTFKLDSGKVSDNSWLQLQQNMVAINDAIKAESNNVHIMITFQLTKGSTRIRHFTQENIGVSKNIVDVASTCLMIRNLYDDERPGEKKELTIYKIIGDSGKSKTKVTLDPDKYYQILFITKNREGSHDYQIVLEHDLSRNILKEVGYTHVPMDF